MSFQAPKNLNDVIKTIDKSIGDKFRAEFAKEPAERPGSKYHFSIGMGMRNTLGLWDKKQPITKWFRKHGVWHADDMSAIIFKAYWCFLNDVPFNIVKEAIDYKKYWQKKGVGFDGNPIKNEIDFS